MSAWAQKAIVLDWEWFWTAPEPGSGPVAFSRGFVDGSGDLKAFSEGVAVLKPRAVEVC